MDHRFDHKFCRQQGIRSKEARLAKGRFWSSNRWRNCDLISRKSTAAVATSCTAATSSSSSSKWWQLANKTAGNVHDYLLWGNIPSKPVFSPHNRFRDKGIKRVMLNLCKTFTAEPPRFAHGHCSEQKVLVGYRRVLMCICFLFKSTSNFE